MLSILPGSCIFWKKHVDDAMIIDTLYKPISYLCGCVF